MKLSELLKKTHPHVLAKRLGYHRTVLLRLADRGAVVIDGIVYAPVTKRSSRKEPATPPE